MSIVNGWIILEKPTGITSAHAVVKVKRLLKPDKIGHAGTLDPLASGILPLALGEATKTVGYMMDASKAYAFTVNWGTETDTDDLEGKITQTSPKKPSNEEILAILPQFLGEIDQIPPNYSAIKVDGKRAYDMAREGEKLELKARKVSVYSLEIAEYSPDKTTFTCHCGKGTYIRSLARDMGRAMDCLGHVAMLRRLKVGKFNEMNAISLEKMEEMVHKDELGFVLPVEAALDDILALSITPEQATRLMHGMTVAFDSLPDNEIVVAKAKGKLVAICEALGGNLKPKRVFNII